MKNSKTAIKAFLLVISISWSAQAYLVPGQPGGGNRPAPYPGEGPGGGHLTPGHPGQPGHPGHPGRPGRPGRPGYPGQPDYPVRPLPPPPPPRPLPPRPLPPPPPSNPGYPGYGSEVKRVYVSRNIYNETLALRQLGGIGQQYQGYEVTAVRVNLRPTYNTQTMLQLVSDGQVVATQYSSGYQADLYPQRLLVLDQTARTLQLAINGNVFVDSVDIELRRGSGGYYPPPPGYGQNIEINVYRSVYGNDRIDLTPHIDMIRYRGRVIEQVLVRASSRYNMGLISLLINGFNMGQAQFSGGLTQVATYRLNQPMMIGQGADSLVLYTQGDLTVEGVTIVLR